MRQVLVKLHMLSKDLHLFLLDSHREEHKLDNLRIQCLDLPRIKALLTIGFGQLHL